MVQYTFLIFCSVTVNDYAEMKTDPSFMLQSSNIVAPKVDKTLLKPTRYRVPVAVNKTDISQTNGTAQTSVFNPDKQWPIPGLNIKKKSPLALGGQ